MLWLTANLAFQFLFLILLLFKIAAKLYLPKVNRSSGAVIDMWIKVLLIILLCSSIVLVVGTHNINHYTEACESQAILIVFVRQKSWMQIPTITLNS